MRKLSVDQLYRFTRFDQDPRQHDSDLKGYMRQVHPRAFQSLSFGLHLNRSQNHIFVMGTPGVGRIGMVKAMLEDAASHQPVPDDLLLVADFEHRHQTQYLYLPAGRGQAFKEAVESLIVQLKMQLPLLFDGAAYQQRTHELDQQLKEQQEVLLEPAYALAKQLNVEIDQRDSNGFILYARHEGKRWRLNELKNRDEALFKRFEQAMAQVEKALNTALSHFPQLEHAHQEAGRQLNTETALAHVRPLIEDLKVQFGEREAVRRYLDALQQGIIARLHLFWDQNEGVTSLSSPTRLDEWVHEEDGMAVFGVNLLVDNSGLRHAPVIYEEHVTLSRLMGYTLQARSGNSNDTQVLALNHQAGLLQQAHGGFLMLPADKVVTDEDLWQELKTALMSHRLSFTMPESNQVVPYHLPDFPLSVTLVLVGRPVHFHMLQAVDRDFERLFKVQVEFESELERTAEHELALAARLHAEVARWQDLPVSVCALERMIEYAARLAEDQQRLYSNKALLRDMMAEAQAWARAHGKECVTREVVEAAIAQHAFHSGLMEHYYHRAVQDRQILLDLEGRRVGQVNGLVVIEMRHHEFGQPIRITCQASAGDEGVMDIEREADMAGPIHSKGVLILSGFVRGRYLQERNYGFSASIVVEQSYEDIEGDSASLAELCALISALAQCPLRQDLALTGSVNQFGEVQPVGGVNEKIEGFFKICQARGLTGQQGVLIPEANVRHLMLAQSVRDAVEAGQFHIYAVRHVDEALTLLTDQPAEQVHEQAQVRLAQWAEKEKGSDD